MRLGLGDLLKQLQAAAMKINVRIIIIFMQHFKTLFTLRALFMYEVSTASLLIKLTKLGCDAAAVPNQSTKITLNSRNLDNK